MGGNCCNLLAGGLFHSSYFDQPDLKKEIV
jgi:hypothetical protein